MTQKVCLNLGCGMDYRKSTKREKWINVDRNENLKADMHEDIGCGFIWGDNYADYILASHLIEHIYDLELFMDECWRVLKNGGVMDIIAPYWTDKWVWGDPTHVRAITEDTFIFWDEEVIKRNKERKSHMTILDTKARFKLIKKELRIYPDMLKRYQDARDLKFAIEHYNNVVSEIFFRLEAVKK